MTYVKLPFEQVNAVMEAGNDVVTRHNALIEESQQLFGEYGQDKELYQLIEKLHKAISEYHTIGK